MKIIGDFETYSELDLTIVGAYRYAIDPSTEVLMLSYQIGNGELKLWVPCEDGPFPQELIDAINNGYEFRAYNVFFDRNIWNHVLIKQAKECWGQDIPSIPIEQSYDIQAKSAAHALPIALEKSGSSLNLGEDKQKLRSGKALMKIFSMPQKDGSRIYPEQRPNEWKSYKEYGWQDTEVAKIIDRMLPDMPPKTLEFWYLDQRINTHGIEIETDAANIIRDKAIEEVANYNTRISELTDGRITTLNQGQRVQKLAAELDFTLPNFQAQTVQDALEGKLGEVPDLIYQILEMRFHGGKSSVNKLNAMASAACPDGRVRGTIVFHGARTGRGAGRIIQPHNFPKPSVEYDDDMDMLIHDLVYESIDYVNQKYGSFMKAASTALRGLIIAGEGNEMYISDFAAIEARLVFYLASCFAGLDRYAKGIDNYIDMATTIYGISYEDVGSKERWLGKQAILGCGYGLGAKGFVNSCANWNVEIPYYLAETAVNAYRSKYPEVVTLWNDTEAAAMNACVYPGKVYQIPNGLLKFCIKGEFLYMKIPSGRYLAYPFPRIDIVKTPWGQKKRAVTYRTLENNHWHRTSTYGGKLVENACQAIAHDIKMEAAINLEKKGYHIITEVHDELIGYNKKGVGSAQEFNDIMEIVPDYLPDCPIEAETETRTRYQKI